MADEEKASGPLAWIKTAKDKIRAFAYRGEPQRSERPRVGVAARSTNRNQPTVSPVCSSAFCHRPVAAGCAGAVDCGADKASELAKKAAANTVTTFADFGRWTPSWLGLATNQRMEKFLARFTPVRTFEELQTPLAVATTDIIDGVTVYYSHGDIVPPLRGSCAYPGLFVPIQHENRTLVDGFLTAPVPIEGVLLLGADIVIAVYLESGNIEQPRTLTDILSRSFNIMQRHADFAWRAQADIIIEPDVKQFVWDDFTRTPDMVAAGEVAALQALPQIRAALRGEKRDSAPGGNLSTAILK